MNAIRSYCSAITALLLSVTGAAAQLPPPTVVPPVPNPNPSSSLVLPPPQQVPVSPGPGGSGGGGLSLLHPYHSVCSVFRHGPRLAATLFEQRIESLLADACHGQRRPQNSSPSQPEMQACVDLQFLSATEP